MAHEITETDAIAYGHGTSKGWHGKGYHLRRDIPVREAVREVLPWEVELVPVFAEFTRPVSEACLAVDEHGNLVEVPARYETVRVPLDEYRAHLRVNTDGTATGLGVVSEGYGEVTNAMHADFAAAVVAEANEQGAATGRVWVPDCVLSVRGGRRTCITLTGGMFEAAPGDEVRSNLIVANGHGGHGLFSAFYSSTRVVCQNTLNGAEGRDAERGIRFKHRQGADAANEGTAAKTMAEKIRQARTVLGLAYRSAAKFEERAKALAARTLTADETRALLASIYVETFGPRPNADSHNATSVETYDRKRAEIEGRWLANLEDERQRIGGGNGTAWGALNAVTQWHEHERGRFRADSDAGQSARLDSNLFGIAARDKGKAFRLALATL